MSRVTLTVSINVEADERAQIIRDAVLGHLAQHLDGMADDLQDICRDNLDPHAKVTYKVAKDA